MKDGGAIFERAVTEMASITEALLRDHGLTVDDVAFFAFHQASQAIVHKVTEALGVAMDRTLVNFPRVGNCTAASVPLVLSEAAESGRLAPGDLVVLVATGGGFTAGACLLRWETP